MNTIKITKKTSHRTDQMYLIISILCLVDEIHLSKTEITVLTYFVVHGIKPATDSLLINSGVTKLGQLGNIKTKLTKLGFLKRDKSLYNTYSLNIDKDFTADDVINLFIKVDNS